MGIFSFLKKNKKDKSYSNNIKDVAMQECNFYEKKISELGIDGIVELLPQNAITHLNEVESQLLKIDPNKKNLLIIDDNLGLISLINDILEMSGLNKDINSVCIQTSYAGFIYKIITEKYNLKIDYAIIDITFGGIVVDAHDGNIKYEGIMVFKDLINKNKELKYLFYTGNSLNKYVYSSKKIIDIFQQITNDDIMKHVVYKNQYPPSKLITIVKNLIKGQ